MTTSRRLRFVLLVALFGAGLLLVLRRRYTALAKRSPEPAEESPPPQSTPAPRESRPAPSVSPPPGTRPLRRARRSLVALALSVGFFAALPAADARRHVVPAGFEDTLVASVTAPTALAFTPDGRMLITTQAGRIRVVSGGTLLAASALNLTAVTCSNSERGLLGIAVDPSFAANGFVYVYYTRNKPAGCVNRVSRFTLGDDNVVDPASELVLVDEIPSPGGNHNAGDVHFGKDGFLYVSVGDGGCDWAGSGCGGSNDAARDEYVLLGKILRITKTGGIPASNPYQGAGTARCNVTGRTTAGLRCQETYSWGLRNPFRIAFDPNAAGTRFFINDVGQNTWEEIDEGAAAADYGWNVREGHCARGSTSNCGPPPAGMTNPIHDYAHDTGCASITGGAFVPAGVWPSAYDGDYLFGDYVCGKIFRLDGGTRVDFVTGLGANSAVHMTFGPHGGTQALYYTTYASGGQVRRIAFVGSGNRAPTAVATANPTSGAAPLTVQFDGAGSSDPDGDALSYAWDLDGDGAFDDSTAVSPSFTYAQPGSYTAGLRVDDGRGGTDTEAVAITVGNTPPAASIDVPASGARFRAGEAVTLRGSATDAQDGTLPSSSLTWQVLRHHGASHTHPWLQPTTGNDVPITTPGPEDWATASTSFLEVRLTATDSQGASTTVTRRFDPRPVDLTFVTDPPGLQVLANGEALVGPRTVTSWEGFAFPVEAPAQTDGSGTRWRFASWSDGGAATHTIATPATAATFTARFVEAPPAPARADFDGDGKTDIAVWRPSTGAWWLRGTPGFTWGTNGDVPVPADFDGDGKTDVAIWRPSTGAWAVRGSPAVVWGVSGDVPVPADYDGDGRAEIAVWRPSTGAWWIRGAPTVSWGVNGDVPVPGNYDADPQAEIAIWRPSTGAWAVRGSAPVTWGVSSDVPVPADYDGDGLDEIAVWRPATGVWWVRGSAAVAWGTGGDVPVPGDYTGDGSADLAFWRPASGTWAVRGTPATAWGVSTDKPLPVPAAVRQVFFP